jgi:uncharacterized protein YkwD
MSNHKLSVQPRTIALLLLAAAMLLAFAALRPAPGVARGGCPGASGGPDATSTAAMRQATICLINHLRHQHGLGSVHSDNSLRKAAQGHSDDMVRRDYFSHDSPGGSSIQTRIGGSGYFHGARSYAYGEIIGGGTSQGGSPKAVSVAWMHSPPHRAAILTGRFRDLGVGVSHGFPGRGSHGATFTVDFGSRH